MWLSHATQLSECYEMVTDCHLLFLSGSLLKNARSLDEPDSLHIFLSPAY